MSTASFYKAQPRLAKMLRKPGGVQVRRALADAQAALEGMQEQLLEAIDQAIAEIDACLPAWPGTAERLYGWSTRIIDASVLPGEKPLEQAARSLCDILDQLDPASPQTLEAVRVHIQSIKLLHRGDPSPAARQSVLDGLQAVCAKLLVAPPAEIPSEVLEVEAEGAEPEKAG